MAGISKLKEACWRACAKYIKLLSTLEDFEKTKNTHWVICRTCGAWLVSNSKNAQAGHYIGRGVGGRSGVYFDERNIAIQCYQCNHHRQGNTQAFREYLLDKYGDKVLDELRIKDKIHHYTEQEIIGLTLLYKEKAKELKRELATK